MDGRRLSVFVDTRATHTFVSEGVSMMLGLKVTSHPSQIKIDNAKAKPLFEVISNACVELRSFEGRISMMEIKINDFHIIV